MSGPFCLLICIGTASIVKSTVCLAYCTSMTVPAVHELVGCRLHRLGIDCLICRTMSPMSAYGTLIVGLFAAAVVGLGKLFKGALNGKLVSNGCFFGLHAVMGAINGQMMLGGSMQLLAGWNVFHGLTLNTGTDVPG